ncbi:MAG: ABC transporter permease [Acidobacteria bacterium]|nr:ABC transporter permease [Acidobacteriota bacterium]
MPKVTGDFRRDAGIQDELADHCVAREEELRQKGIPTADAVRQVQTELDATVRRRNALGAAADRQLWAARSSALGWLIQSWQDVRYSIRLLARTPGATLAAVATLALTIGATTAIFSVVQAVLLRPLPYPDSDRLVRVWEDSPQGPTRNVVSAGNYLAWSERATSLQSLGAFRSQFDTALIEDDGPPEKVSGATVSPSVVNVLRVRPFLGAWFTPGPAAAGQPTDVVISASFWQRRFGGDPAIIGRVLNFEGGRVTVTGVAPAGFAFPSPALDVWYAERFSTLDRDSFRSHNYNVIARLAPGVSLEQAQAEMTTLASGLALEQPADMAGWDVNVVPAHADDVREVRPLLLVLMGVVAVVLLIACANLATLQLARASRRRLEMSVRSAIGAGWARLVRQLLVESVVVALAGGLVGLVILASSLQALILAAPSDIPFLDTVRIDGAVFGFTMAITMACALMVGLLPALSISRADSRSLLQTSRGTVGRSETRLRHGLVAAQIGLALVLLVSAGLLTRSFWNLQAVDHGFDPSHLLTVSLDLPGSRYPDADAQVAFYESLGERLQALPGVVAAAGTTATPGRGAGMTFSFAIEGRPATNSSGREDPAPLQGITPGFFDTMRIPLIEGRTIAMTDRSDTPMVVAINETLAHRLLARRRGRRRPHPVSREPAVLRNRRRRR